MEENPPVRVYDTSGPWTDPGRNATFARACRPSAGLDRCRGDVEEYEGREILPQDNGYLTKGAEEFAKFSSPHVSGHGSRRIFRD